MADKGLEPVGTPELARYNPPITPPFFRRNEVLIRYQWNKPEDPTSGLFKARGLGVKSASSTGCQ
jgi:hypothetical protein